MSTRLILVGGFLGAGKTTLLQQAAARLAARGRRVALLANDQAADLVDTAVLEQTKVPVDEVAGGCFCCRFQDMISAIDRLKVRARPEYIIAEPVGSCTDISATVLQPLKKLHGLQIELSLYSVLIDVRQARTLLRMGQKTSAPSGFAGDVLYIYRKQVEEADLIVLNKADLVAAGELDELRASLAVQFPATPIVTISALTGEGVDHWLDLLAQPGVVGGKICDVDYDTYAAGEAALGWMNASAALSAAAPADWESFAERLLESVRARVRQAGGHIGHLKLHLAAQGRGELAGNITGNESPAMLRGAIPSDARQASLLLNARVEIDADLLRQIAECSMREVAAEATIDAVISSIASFFPSRPVPVHRFTEVAR